jgi:hypothetical protein
MGVSAVSLGLLISARAERLEQAVGLATGAAIAQVALNGVTINLSGVLRWTSYVIPSRWGMGALASSTNLPELTVRPATGPATGPQPGPRVRPLTTLGTDALWQHSLDRWLVDLGALCVFSVLCAVLATVALRSRLRGSAR